MSDTKKSNKYNACLKIQVGPDKELTVGGKTIKLFNEGRENNTEIAIKAALHTINPETGERIDEKGQKLKSITPEVLKELRKAVERKIGPNKLKNKQSENKLPRKQGASR